MMTPHLTKSLALLALCLALTGPRSLAQSTPAWTGTGTNTNWNNPDNWTPASVPATSATVYFGEADSYTVSRNTTGTALSQLIFTEDAGAYTFTGNPLRLATSGLQVVNYSGETQTFSAGLSIGAAGAVINTAKGDVIVENGVEGGSNRVPAKDGIGTLTIRGTSNVQLGVSIRAGTLVLDKDSAQTFGTTTITYQGTNTSALEIIGGDSGTTTVTRTGLTLNPGNNAASQIRLDSNGGDGVTLNFNDASSALGRLSSSLTLNVDLSSNAANRVTFASINGNSLTPLTNGIFKWATVTDTVGTGLATLDGTNFVRNTATSLFTGSGATVDTANYNVGNGTTTLTATRTTYSLAIHATSGGNLSSNSLQTGALLVQEGTTDYAINSNLLSPANGAELYLHQYSTDGTLILNGNVYNDLGTGSLIKTGPGTVQVGSTGSLRTTGVTYVQGGRFVVDGAIARSSEVRVFDTATLKGSGSIGTLAASAVHLYGGGTLAGSTDAALAINGTLALDSYSHFAMTLTYAGADYVDVSGAVTLDTEADLALALAAAPTLGLNVLLLKGSGITGSFATVNGESFGPAGTFTLEWNSQDYQFQLFQNSNQAWVQALPAVPEPSTALLAGVGAAFLFLRRRLRGARAA